jgi:predicted transcriptional regulator
MRKQPMQTAKQDVRELLDHLPDDSTIEDIQYHLYVLEKIRRGQEDIRDGKHYTHEEVKERLGRWLKS